MHRAKVAYSVFFFLFFLLQAQFSVTFFDGLWVERVYPQLLRHTDPELQSCWDRLQHGSDQYSILPRWRESSGLFSVIIRLVVFLSQTALLSSFLIIFNWPPTPNSESAPLTKTSCTIYTETDSGFILLSVAGTKTTHTNFTTNTGTANKRITVCALIIRKNS